MYALLEETSTGVEVHTNWLSLEEAELMRVRHEELYPDATWSIEPHFDSEPFVKHRNCDVPMDLTDGFEEDYD
jgi:hypothetical protein